MRFINVSLFATLPLLLVSATALAQMNDRGTAAQRAAASQLENGVVLSGYDPVSYHKGEPKAGSPDIVSEYKGVTYRFASEENRNVFEGDPSSYDVAYGGWCGYSMSQGKKVVPDPENYKIVNGKLVVFFDGFFGDGKKAWEKEARKSGEDAIVKKSDAHWRDILER